MQVQAASGLLLAGLWLAYFALHSLLASLRVKRALVFNDARNNCAKPCRIRRPVLLAVNLVTEAMGFIFGHDFQNAGAADIHLVERLNGGQSRCAALVGDLDVRQ